MTTPTLLSKEELERIDELLERSPGTWGPERVREMRAHIVALEAELRDERAAHQKQREATNEWWESAARAEADNAALLRVADAGWNHRPDCTCSECRDAAIVLQAPHPGTALLLQHRQALAAAERRHETTRATMYVRGEEHRKAMAQYEKALMQAGEVLGLSIVTAPSLVEAIRKALEHDRNRAEVAQLAHAVAVDAARVAVVRARNDGLERAAVLADNAAQSARLIRANMGTSFMRTAQDKAAETASDLAVLIRREKEPEE